MLKRRAISMGSRDYFQDVLLGMVYLPDEIGAWVDEDGNPVAARDAGRGPMTVHVSEEVSAFSLQIYDAKTPDAINDIWNRVKAADQLDACNLHGQTLRDMMKQRADAIKPRKAVELPQKPAEEPAAVAETTTDPAPPENPAEEPAAEESGEVRNEPDPEDTRVEDDDREQLCDILASIHPDGWGGVKRDVMEQRGLDPSDVATEWLQDYGLRLRGQGQ
jgi:hypothetical protein